MNRRAISTSKDYIRIRSFSFGRDLNTMVATIGFQQYSQEGTCILSEQHPYLKELQLQCSYFLFSNREFFLKIASKFLHMYTFTLGPDCTVTNSVWHLPVRVQQSLS